MPVRPLPRRNFAPLDTPSRQSGSSAPIGPAVPADSPSDRIHHPAGVTDSPAGPGSPPTASARRVPWEVRADVEETARGRDGTGRVRLAGAGVRREGRPGAPAGRA